MTQIELEQRLALIEQRLARHDDMLTRLRELAMRSPVGRAIVKAIGLG